MKDKKFKNKEYQFRIPTIQLMDIPGKQNRENKNMKLSNK